MSFFITLIHELVTRCAYNFKILVLVFFVKLFQSCILTRKTAFRSNIDEKNNLSHSEVNNHTEYSFGQNALTFPFNVFKFQSVFDKVLTDKLYKGEDMFFLKKKSKVKETYWQNEILNGLFIKKNCWAEDEYVFA